MQDHLDSTDSSESRAEQRDRLWSLIKDIRLAMFTSRDENGHLHAWPMTTQNKTIDEENSLWFFMSLRSDPVNNIEDDPVVNVSYADPSSDSYVSVSGIATIVNDTAKTQELWSKMAEAWFPAGPNDPDLALVKVRIISASYWDVKDSKIVQLFKMAKAAMTGTQPRNMGEHADIRMR